MRVTIRCDINSYDFVSVETTSIEINYQANDGMYHKSMDEKWRKHALKHGFNPNSDCYNPKIWDQYLRLCAESLI